MWMKEYVKLCIDERAKKGKLGPSSTQRRCGEISLIQNLRAETQMDLYI